MNIRMNAGYIITDSIHIGNAEFVCGVNATSHGTMYVTWECKDGDNYFWGHYFDKEASAKKDLLERAGHELEVQQHKQELKAKDKERER